MNSIKLIFFNIVFTLSSGVSSYFTTNVTDNFLDQECSDRWQLIDEMNLRITFDWRIKRSSDQMVIEFRPNLIAKGFWHGFAVSSSSSNYSVIDLIYALRWQNNDKDITWDIYQWTNETTIKIVDTNNTSNVTLQPLFSSGLLTVQFSNLKKENETLDEGHCWNLIYMRGRFSQNQPMIPNEIRSNQSLCLSCPKDIQSTTPIEVSTTAFSTSTSFVSEETTSNRLELTMTMIPSSTTIVIAHIDERTEVKMIWIGRLINHVWSYDYSNLNSSSTEHLRLQLQNLFIRLINADASHPFILTQFSFFSLHPRSDSLFFAINITLLSNQSRNQTLAIVKTLVQSLNRSSDYSLTFDDNEHAIVHEIDSWSLISLFERLSPSTSPMSDNLVKQRDTDLTLHLLLGSIVSVACFIIVISSLLCLYGYYKCQRRRFRLFLEENTLKLQSNRNTYTWLGHEPSVGTTSSPYFIQSTSI